MDGYSTLRKISRALLCNSFAIAAVAAALAFLPAAAPPAFAADEAPSAADQHCLGCHGAAGMEKKLAQPMGRWTDLANISARTCSSRVSPSASFFSMPAAP